MKGRDVIFRYNQIPVDEVEDQLPIRRDFFINSEKNSKRKIKLTLISELRRHCYNDYIIVPLNWLRVVCSLFYEGGDPVSE